MTPARLLLLLAVVAAVLAALYGVKRLLIPSSSSRQGRAPQPPSGTSSANPLMGMRDELLRGPASKFHIEPAPSGAWGCLMEMGGRGSDGNACVTLVSLNDGTTSLYFSTGGGFIGGGGHETVAAASKRLTNLAGQYVASMNRTAEFPMPLAHRVRFYVLMSDGVFTSEASENELEEGRHRLSPLFLAGHEVITEFRLVTDKQQ